VSKAVQLMAGAGGLRPAASVRTSGSIKKTMMRSLLSEAQAFNEADAALLRQ